MPVTTRDLLSPILQNVPKAAARVPGITGGLLVALIAAINPLSYFTSPYIGIVSWLILSWWFYNKNPLSIVRTTNAAKWNPGWWQTTKSLFWGLLLNPIPMFFIYTMILFIARFDAKLTT
jgi:hypothetical protein